MAENEIRIAGGLLQDFTQLCGFEQAGLPPQEFLEELYAFFYS
jgi:hypothetical protein